MTLIGSIIRLTKGSIYITNVISQLPRSSEKSIEQKRNVKLLDILSDENLSCNDQINKLIKSSHSTLRALRKFGRFTPYHDRKYLILSKLNYGIAVFAQIPNYMVQRLKECKILLLRMYCHDTQLPRISLN